MRIRVPNISRINPAIFVYLLIFLTPYSFYSIELVGGIGLTPVNIFSLVLIFITICIIISRNAIPLIPSINNLHILYIFIAMTSSIYASNQFSAIRGTGAYLLEFYTCFLFPLLFLKTRKHIETAVYIFIIAGVINAVMGWIELIGFFVFKEVITPPFGELFFNTTKAYGYIDRGGIGAFSIPGFMRMYGFMDEGSNTFGTYMIISFGLSLYLLNKNKSKYNWILSIFLLVTCFASVSRNAIIGLFFLVLFIFYIRAIKSGIVIKLVLKIYTVIFLISIILLLSLLIKQFNFLPTSSVVVDVNKVNANLFYLIERFNPFMSESITKSFSYFTDHLKIAIIHLTDNFGFGMGLQNFDDFVYRNYRSEIIGYSAHSNFIIFLGDTGIWGFLVQVMIVIMTIKYGLTTYFRQTGKNNDTLPLYLTAVYSALVLTGIIRTYYLETFTFIIMGLISKIYLLDKYNKNPQYLN